MAFNPILSGQHGKTQKNPLAKAGGFCLKRHLKAVYFSVFTIKKCPKRLIFSVPNVLPITEASPNFHVEANASEPTRPDAKVPAAGAFAVQWLWTGFTNK